MAQIATRKHLSPLLLCKARNRPGAPSHTLRCSFESLFCCPSHICEADGDGARPVNDSAARC